MPVCGIFSSPYFLFYSLLSFRIFFSLLFVNVIPTISCYLGYFLVSLICPDIPKLFCDPCYFLLFLTFPFMPVVSCCHCYSIHIFFFFYLCYSLYPWNSLVSILIPAISVIPWFPPLVSQFFLLLFLLSLLFPVIPCFYIFSVLFPVVPCYACYP